jgi:hypothetical protein
MKKYTKIWILCLFFTNIFFQIMFHERGLVIIMFSTLISIFLLIIGGIFLWIDLTNEKVKK